MERRKKEIGEEATALKEKLTSFDKLEAKRKELNNKKTELARMQKEIEERASKPLEKQVRQSWGMISSGRGFHKLKDN